jgi:hypothetical protein
VKRTRVSMFMNTGSHVILALINRESITII